MRVAFIFGEPPIGKHDAFLKEIELLTLRGIDCSIMTLREEGKELDRFVALIPQSRSLGAKSRLLFQAAITSLRLSTRAFPLFLAAARGWLSFDILIASLAASARLDLSQVDAFFVHFCEAQAQASAVLAILHKKKLVVHTHHSDIVTRSETSYDCFALRVADALISVDRISERHVVQMPSEFVPPMRFVLPAAADVERFAPSSATRDWARLLFVGRLVPLKKVEDLLRAVRALVGLGYVLHLDIVGDGPDREHLEATSEQLQLSSNVTFKGSLAGESLTSAYQEAGIFVLASQMEGTPRVLMEASASGMAVVATRVGGIPTLLPHEAIFLFEPGDIAGLTTHIRRLLDDASLAKMAGEHARKHSMTFTIEARLNELERLIRAVVPGAPRYR